MARDKKRVVGEFWIYIMASASRVIYTGVTSNLEKRVFEHKTGVVPGFTRLYNCHRLVYFEPYDTAYTAISREKQIKSWRREKKVVLIETSNPDWRDLSEEWL
jgi:putative endonuclease